MKSIEDSINADIALKNRLYVSGWELSSSLKHAREYPDSYIVLLEWSDDLPVGVVLYCVGSREMQFFVKKAYRRKGIGTKLFKKLKDRIPHTEFRYDLGITGSGYFFNSVLMDKEHV